MNTNVFSPGLCFRNRCRGETRASSLDSVAMRKLYFKLRRQWFAGMQRRHTIKPYVELFDYFFAYSTARCQPRQFLDRKSVADRGALLMSDSATIKPGEVQTGKIKFYSDERGYGFLIPDDEGTDLFFHIRAVAAGFYPRAGDRVSFIEAKDRAGRRCAEKVAAAR